MAASAIDWEWDETETEEAAATTAGRLFSVAFAPDRKTAELRCRDLTDDIIRWSHRLLTPAEDRVAMAADADNVYVALYWHGSTGCQVLAFDGGSGRRLWETRLVGLGSVGHSRYANRVQMRIREGKVAVFGNEASGKYIEVLDPATGEQVQHRKVEG